MEAAFLVTGTVAYGAILLLIARGTFRKRESVFREAAEELGLRMTSSFHRWRFELEGWIGSVHVAVKEWQKRKNAYATEIRLIPGGLPEALTLSAQKGGGWLQRFRGPLEDHLVGDAMFDEAVVVQGPVHEALARLDSGSREALRHALAWKETGVSGGTIVREIPERMEAAAIIGEVRDLLGVVEHLRLHGSDREALARNAAGDPVAGVRLRNLEVLQGEFPASPEAKQASRQALVDGDGAVRLQGAAFLGEEGLPTLLELAEPLEPSSEERAEAARHGRHLSGTPHHVQVEALRRLLHACDVGEIERKTLEPVVRRQLERGNGRPRRYAARMVGHLRLEGCLNTLRRLLSDADEETAIALSDTLGRFRTETVEEDLLVLLRFPSPAVRERAVLALEACGTVRSVEPLRDLARNAANHDLDRAIDRAITAIQSRIEGAEAGQLTLADTDAEQGALTLAGGDPGDLTLVPAKPGLPDRAVPRDVRGG